MGETNYGSIRKIAYIDGKVKVQNPKTMTDMQRKLFEAVNFAVAGSDLLGNEKIGSFHSSTGNILSMTERVGNAL